jgi:hypothetical protein
LLTSMNCPRVLFEIDQNERRELRDVQAARRLAVFRAVYLPDAAAGPVV